MTIGIKQNKKFKQSQTQTIQVKHDLVELNQAAESNRGKQNQINSKRAKQGQTESNSQIESNRVKKNLCK